MDKHRIGEQVKTAIGDTLLVYQYIEHIMKSIAAPTEFTVPIYSAEKAIQKRLDCVAKSTMGTVAEAYLKIFEPFDEHKEFRVDTIHFRVCLVVDGMDVPAWTKDIGEMVDDRNWLVHGAIVDLTLEDVEGRDNAVARIKECRVRARNVLTKLLVHNEMMKSWRERMRDVPLAKIIEIMNLANDILCIMQDRKQMKPDKEGWVSMDRLRGRCMDRFGERLRDACMETKSKSFVEYLKKQMGGLELRERKTKKSVSLMYRIPDKAD